MKLLLALLFTCLYASEFIPKEFAPPPNTKPKDVPPPLTELAEKEGFSAHLAYTNKLNSDVQNVQKQDINEAAGIVNGVKDLLKKTAAKALTANKRATLEAEKVENDDGNTAAAGIYMEDKIKKVKADAAKATDALDIVKADADAKVQQAQKDVLAKNEIIQSKNQEIDGLNTRLKEEADRQNAICEEKLESQSKAKDEQMEQAVQLKQSEITTANEAKAKAEEAVEEAKRKCGEDMEQQKTANDNALASKDQQMESLKQDIKNKEETISEKDNEKAQAVTEAQQQCDREKEEVRAASKEQCDVQVQKVDDSLKASQRDVEDLNQKIIDVEERVTNEKNTAVEEVTAKLDSLKEACTVEIRQAKKEVNDEGEKRLAAQKAADQLKLKKQQELTAKCLSDSQVNMANKEKQCKDQSGKLTDQIKAKNDELTSLDTAMRDLKNKYTQLAQSVKDQIMAQRRIRAQTAATLQTPPDLLEEMVAAPAMADSVLNISSTALAVYTSLILSALFLCGLIYKLRGHLVKHKNYSAVLADA